MNCEKCQELLSDFLDGALGGHDRALLRAHLEECLNCASVRDEFESIIGVARAARGYDYAPPNERAMWLRIRNTIESENDQRRASAARLGAGAGARAGLWARLMGRRWEFSLPQLATGVAGLAVAVSLVTTLGVQYLAPAREADSGPRPRAVRAVAANYPQGYLQPHQASLQYWQERAELRKASWNPRMRDSFDRSLTALDQAVSESLNDLRQNPHDEVAEQMLNSALRDKIELLREFSE
jgi:hypothetical protein